MTKKIVLPGGFLNPELAEANGLLPPPTAPVLFRDVITQAMQKANLSQKERWVVELRFGLVDDTARTIEEVSRLLCTTVDEVINLEEGAVEKLRKSYTW